MAGRKGQQQPMRSGTGRVPGPSLAAALQGGAAPGAASAMNTVDHQRQEAAAAGAAATAQALHATSLAKAIASGGPKSSATGSPSLAGATTRTRTFTGSQVNDTGNARDGKSYKTFTQTGKPGYEYHRYKIDGKTKTVAVKKKKGTLGAITAP